MALRPPLGAGRRRARRITRLGLPSPVFVLGPPKEHHGDGDPEDQHPRNPHDEPAETLILQRRKGRDPRSQFVERVELRLGHRNERRHGDPRRLGGNHGVERSRNIRYQVLARLDPNGKAEQVLSKACHSPRLFVHGRVSHGRWMAHQTLHSTERFR